jgi:hypothetical protein
MPFFTSSFRLAFDLRLGLFLIKFAQYISFRVPYIMHPIDPVFSWMEAVSLLRQVVAFP